MSSDWSFDDALDQQLLFDDGNAARFGRNVLAGLVDGIREANHRQTSRYEGPVVLGCAMCLDDPELMDVLEQVCDACIVITKQEAWRHGKPKWIRLKRFSEAHQLRAWAFDELWEWAPHDDAGRPRAVGPYDRDWRMGMRIQAVREAGFRKTDRLVPIVHAKLALVGHYRLTDDHPSGHVVDMFGFTPDRLWIGSANFTESSRRNLEMGFWTSRPDLMAAAQRFLLELIIASEPLQTGPNHQDQELLPVTYDEDAMWEAVAAEREDAAWFEDEQ